MVLKNIDKNEINGGSIRVPCCIMDMIMVEVIGE